MEKMVASGKPEEIFWSTQKNRTADELALISQIKVMREVAMQISKDP